MENYFHQILRAILTQNKQLFDETVSAGRENNYTEDDFHIIIDRVDFWCRIRGLKPLLQAETQAVLKLQAVFRKWYTRRKLFQKYELYTRLSQTDDQHYAVIAQKYLNVLKIIHYKYTTHRV